MNKLRKLYILSKLFIFNVEYRKSIINNFKTISYPLLVLNPSIKELKLGKFNELDYITNRFKNKLELNNNSSSCVIVIPNLEPNAIFGGLATAFSFILELKKENRFDLLKVIYLSPKKNIKIEKEFISNLVTYTNNDDFYSSTIFIDSFNSLDLKLSKLDIFVATYWTTAISINNLIQHNNFHYKKFIYLIQDYEPGFYPWSDEYALADSTYSMNIIPVFNTSLLKDFIKRIHPKINNKYFLKPLIRIDQNVISKPTKVIKILIYGRPSKRRNMFGLIVLSLKDFVKNSNNFNNIEFLSIGENHQPIPLGKGVELKSVGKLSYNNYYLLLKEAHIGISLMMSPHPSYPPFDMAANGVQAITNIFENKNLNFSNIHSVPPTEHCISNKLSQIIEMNFDNIECLNENELNSLGYSISEIVKTMNLEFKSKSKV